MLRTLPRVGAKLEMINQGPEIQKFCTASECMCTMIGGFVGSAMTTETVPKSRLTWLGLMAFVALSGLCTIFAFVVTAAQAWQEHAHTRWPEVTAHVYRCGLEQTSIRLRQKYHIHCHLMYEVGAEQHVANFYSRNLPSPKIWQYPPNQIGRLEKWVNDHPPGTPIFLRYDPADHTKMELVATDTPLGGPRLPSNVKQLEVWAGSFVSLLTLARLTRPRTFRQSSRSEGRT
jgi:hypothetical protein